MISHVETDQISTIFAELMQDQNFDSSQIEASYNQMPFVASTVIFLSAVVPRRVNIARMFASCAYAGVVNIMKIYIRLTGGTREQCCAA